MPVEAATTIHQLNSGAPTGAEPLSEADDHLRVIKTAVKGSFTGFGVGIDSGVVTLGADEINALPAALAAGTAVAALVDILFPIGSIYLAAIGTNPATLLGHGTWAARAQGTFLAGVGTGTDSLGEQRSFPAGAAGGTYSHTLTEAQLAAHAHNIYGRADGGNSNNVEGLLHASGSGVGGETGGTLDYVTNNFNGTPIIQNTGTGTAHENTPPAWAIYVWQRTA